MVSVSAYRKVRKRLGQTAGCSRSKKREIKTRSPIHAGNGFLKSCFQPIAEKQEELQNKKIIEKSFFDSLVNLSTLYDFPVLDISSKRYPYNMYLSFAYVKECLNTIRPDLKLILLQDESRPACLATVKVFDTGATLFYIPVYQLMHLLRNKKKNAELLLSVFAYLLQVVKIPYFRDSSTFLHYTYEIICEWVQDEPGEWEEESYRKIMAEFTSLAHGGDIIHRKINSPFHLQQFNTRIKNLSPTDKSGNELLSIATRAFDLMKNYPGRNIFENINPGLIDPCEEERIYPEQYISFIWNDSGWIYDQLIEHINSSLQEYTAIDEPISIQYFDKPQEKEVHQLNFETNLFGLLHDLCDYLNTRS